MRSRPLRSIMIGQVMILFLFLVLTATNEVFDLPHILLHDTATTWSQRSGEIAVELIIFTLVVALEMFLFRRLIRRVRVLEGFLSTAVSEARGHRARITLLHVVDTPGTLMLGEESWSLHGAEDETYLAHLAREIEDIDLPAEFLLLHGHPAEAIVAAVETAGIDMLVMGSHGHRGMDDLVFGQTVSTVRHAIDIPVLVVRSYGREQAQRSRYPVLA